jgi:hypothetical protein
MDAYVIGNLTGRLLMSAIIVWVVLFAFNKFDLKLAWQKLKRPLPVCAVFLLFLLGLVSGARADDDTPKRALRPFTPTTFAEAKLKVLVPARPQWNSFLTPKRGTSSVTLVSPEKFYPATVLELTHNHRFSIPASERDEVALSALNTMRQQAGNKDALLKTAILRTQYGELEAWVDRHSFTQQGQVFDARSIFAVFDNGAPLTIYLMTPSGQLDHVEDLANRIIKHLQPAPDA